jgi:transposase
MLKQEVARPSKNCASKSLLATLMPLQLLSDGRKNKPRWQLKPPYLKCRFTNARVDLVKINNPLAGIIKSAMRHICHWKGQGSLQTTLAPNNIDGLLSMDNMLSKYKSKQGVEKGFRFLKSPNLLTSTFDLKKPERI